MRLLGQRPRSLIGSGRVPKLSEKRRSRFGAHHRRRHVRPRPWLVATRGSALYKVPFQLSRRPSSDWAQHFVQTWNRPPSYSLSHRPGIAHVEGDRIILDGTTVEEVEATHRDTLKAVVEKVNQDIAEHEAKQRRAREAREEQLRQHEQSARDAAKRISFD
jgi:hypothetical protein